MLTGDAETPVEDILKGDISAEILKVGHHGSTSSSSTAFLNKVKPEIAVISVGTGNTYGHPAPETLSKLQASGLKVYRTDLNGNVVVSTDGKSYSVSAENGGSEAFLAVPSTQTTQVQTDTVYVTKTGKKYHQAGCKSLSSSAIPMSLEDAKTAGYEPCSICNP